MDKKKRDTLKEKYAGSFTGKGDHPQANLFGDQDFVFNALQEEISGIHSDIERTLELIEKKKELLGDLKRRKQQLDKAAVMVKDAKHFLKKEEKPDPL
jgi:hypothetical protein